MALSVLPDQCKFKGEICENKKQGTISKNTMNRLKLVLRINKWLPNKPGILLKFFINDLL